MINKKLQAKNTTRSPFYKTEIVPNPSGSGNIKLVWDYFDRFPTEEEIEATRQYAYKLQREAREKKNAMD